MSSAPTPAATCELLLPGGHPCGVQAIGRCVDCQRAFCATHRARSYDNFGNLVSHDLCAECYQKRLAAEAEQQDRAWAGSPERYFVTGDARTALLTAGVPTVEIYDVKKQYKSNMWPLSMFFLRVREIEQITLVGRGWILGEFRWRYSQPGPYPDMGRIVTDCLTALLDETDEGYTRRTGVAAQNRDALFGGRGLATRGGERATPFLRVAPHSPGYERLSTADDAFQGDWEAARQAVRRLIERPIWPV